MQIYKYVHKSHLCKYNYRTLNNTLKHKDIFKNDYLGGSASKFSFRLKTNKFTLDIETLN